MELIGTLIQIGIPLILLVIGYMVGSIREKRHFKQLEEKEARFAGSLMVTNLKMLPEGMRAKEAFLVRASVVIASDYFKTFAAWLKNIIGGKLKTFEALMERGRREALVRMYDKARKQGANVILNVRLETSTIGRGKRNKGLPSVEVIAYATGVIMEPE